MSTELPAEVRDKAAKDAQETFARQCWEGRGGNDSWRAIVDAVVAVVGPHLRGCEHLDGPYRRLLVRAAGAEEALAHWMGMHRELAAERDALSRMLRAMAREKVRERRFALAGFAAKDRTLRRVGKALAKQRKLRKAAEARNADLRAELGDTIAELAAVKGRLGAAGERGERLMVKGDALAARVDKLREALKAIERGTGSEMAYQHADEALTADDRAAAGAKPPVKVEKTLNSRLSSAELCRRNGWGVGTRLVASNGRVIEVEELLGIGYVRALQIAPQDGSHLWDLTAQEWSVAAGEEASRGE